MTRQQHQEVIGAIQDVRNEMVTLAVTVRQRFAEVDQRFEQIDERFAHIDQRFDRMDARIDATRDFIIAEVDAKITASRDQIIRQVGAHIDRVHAELSGRLADLEPGRQPRRARGRA